MRDTPFAVLTLLLLPLGARAATHDEHALGRVRFPVSCTAPAQQAFERAMALLHHMTYPQARAAFREVARTDARCAMAHWGIAMTLFQPLWPTRPGPSDLRAGWDSLQRARALGLPTERERLFVAAAEAFFENPHAAGNTYWQRIARWERAAEGAWSALPDDPEAACFYALALLATTPADRVSTEHAERAARILLRVYERNPEHPGAMHYLVHANDAPGRERESLEITRKYERAAPRNPHALHMPTHIYTRLGDWDGVIRGNLRAADAALEHPAGEQGELVWDEFPHAIEYLIYAYLQRGADADAAKQLARLRGTAKLEPSFKTAFHLASTQARYALERRDWNEAASIIPREPAVVEWNRYAWPEAISRFARALGALRLGRLEEADRAIERLGPLEAAVRLAGESLFERNIRVLALELRAWREQASGRGGPALAALSEAAELEATTPKHAVTPGPTLPAAEQLGELLLEQGDARGALAAYERSLQQYPRRFNSLLGAARAARAAGDTRRERDAWRELVEIADPSSLRPALREARERLTALR